MSRLKISDYAKQNNVCYRTVWNWAKEGKILIEKTDTGRIRVVTSDLEPKEEKVYIYSRVSSYDKKEDLKSQAQLCEAYCAAKGWIVSRVFKEIASGMNDNRKMLNRVFQDTPTKLVILHKDRLTRFGFNYIKMGLEAKGCEIIVVNENSSESEDLLKDFVGTITSFCCKLYGTRKGQAKALKLKEEIKK